MMIISKVKQRAPTLVATEGLLEYRQAKRVWQRYRAQGDAGLAHRSRRRPGLRRSIVALASRLRSAGQRPKALTGPTESV